MDEVEVVAHPPVGVPCPEVHCEFSDLCGGEGLHCGVIIVEGGPHGRVHLVAVYRDQGCVQFLPDDFALPDRDVHSAHAYVAAVAS